MSPRMAVLVAVTAAPATCLLLVIAAGAALQRFLEDVSAIESTLDLDRFKLLAAWNMYAALAAIVLLGLTVLLAGWGLTREVVQVFDLWPSLAIGVAAIISGAFLKNLEQKAQSLPVPDDDLRKERDRVVRVWLQKPFPDW